MSREDNDWAREATLRESIKHGLRSRGWSRIDAENEADDRIERLRKAAENNCNKPLAMPD